MKRFRITTIATVATVLALSACAPIERPPSAGEVADTVVFVSGDRADRLDIATLRQKLSALEGIDLTTEDGRAKLKGELDKIETYAVPGADVPDPVKGIGGFYTRLQFRTALSPAAKIETQRLSGKIRRYIFNKNTMSGYLEVDTVVETLVNGVPVARDTYWWSIAVLPGTYRVVPRKNNQPRDPFPNTVPLPDAALDPDNPRGIWKRGLDHKLFAKGPGIVVLAASKNGDLIPANDPVYQSDSDSCVDLLFKDYPPEQTLPPQSGYCLGRCQDPLVVNTGA